MAPPGLPASPSNEGLGHWVQLDRFLPLGGHGSERPADLVQLLLLDLRPAVRTMVHPEAPTGLAVGIQLITSCLATNPVGNRLRQILNVRQHSAQWSQLPGSVFVIRCVVIDIERLSMPRYSAQRRPDPIHTVRKSRRYWVDDRIPRSQNFPHGDRHAPRPALGDWTTRPCNRTKAVPMDC